MARERISSWHADQPEETRGQSWQHVARALRDAGDPTGADALADVMRLTDAIRGRVRHWADTVLHGRSSGSWTAAGGSRNSGDMPYAVECAVGLLDVAGRIAAVASDYELGVALSRSPRCECCGRTGR